MHVVNTEAVLCLSLANVKCMHATLPVPSSVDVESITSKHPIMTKIHVDMWYVHV